VIELTDEHIRNVLDAHERELEGEVRQRTWPIVLAYCLGAPMALHLTMQFMVPQH
jgi:hypothetical protein